MQTRRVFLPLATWLALMLFGSGLQALTCRDTFRPVLRQNILTLQKSIIASFRLYKHARTSKQHTAEGLKEFDRIMVVRKLDRAFAMFLHASSLRDLFIQNYDLTQYLLEPQVRSKEFIRYYEHAIAKALVSHPNGLEARAEVIRELGSGWVLDYSFRFFDELMGVDHVALEMREDAEGMRASKQDAQNLGLGSTHSNWFSNHSQIIHMLQEAHDRGIRRVVDLGSGTGRVGLLAAFLFPDMSFVGLDIYAPRIQAAQAAAERWGFQRRIQFRVQDLLDRKQAVPEADLYYIFGPTNDPEINNGVVNRLREVYDRRNFFVASTHPRTSSILLKKSWLQPRPQILLGGVDTFETIRSQNDSF